MYMRMYRARVMGGTCIYVHMGVIPTVQVYESSLVYLLLLRSGCSLSVF